MVLERRSGSGSGEGSRSDQAAAVTLEKLKRHWCELYPGFIHDLAGALGFEVPVVKARAVRGELTRADVEAGLEYRRQRVNRAIDEELGGG